MSILTEAEAIVNGARQQDYGEPIVNHSCTAGLWSSWLRRRHGVEINLTPEDVCMLMVLQKVSRLAQTPDHRDSLVDIAGYCLNVEKIADSRG